MSTVGEQVLKYRYNMSIRVQQENKDSVCDKTRVKTRLIKYHRTPRITYNSDLAIPKVRDLLQGIVEVTESQRLEITRSENIEFL
jgi:hypothetical protein